jgi:hypothetical protein
MACADLSRLAEYERLSREGTLAASSFVSPSFSLHTLTPIPVGSDGLRTCAHPLHSEWFPSRSVRMAPSLFVSDTSPACRYCTACNRAMNTRNEERVKVQMELAERDRNKHLMLSKAKKAAAKAALSPAQSLSDWRPSPVPQARQPPPLSPPPPQMKSRTAEEEPAKKVSKREKKRTPKSPDLWTPRGKVPTTQRKKAEIPKDVKMRSCVGCKVEFCFFPDHEAYEELPDAFVCNNCVDLVVCFGCNTAAEDMDAEMVLCDGCLLAGAHFSCLGLPAVPAGSWYCRFCVWHFEPNLVGEPWLCVDCGLLNHSRWPKLLGFCLGCRAPRRPQGHLLKPSIQHPANPLIDWVVEQPQREDVLTWGWSDIADFCFVLAYGNGAAEGMERESFVAALRRLNLTAREWLKRGAAPENVAGDASLDDTADEVMRPVYDWLMRGARFLHKVLPETVESEPFALSKAIRSSQARSAPSMTWASASASVPVPAPLPPPPPVVEKKQKTGRPSAKAVALDSAFLEMTGLTAQELMQQQRAYQKYQDGGSGKKKLKIVMSDAVPQVTPSIVREPYFADAVVKKKPVSKAGLSLAASADVSRKSFEDDSDELFQDGFDDVSQASGNVLEQDKNERKRRLPGVRLLPLSTNLQSPEICTLVHRLCPNLVYEKFVGRMVWVRFEDSLDWLPAQVVLQRDVPPEYAEQVAKLFQSIRGADRQAATLVAYFDVPYRSYAWVFPHRGEVAEFNNDFIEFYLDYAAFVASVPLLVSLTLAKRILQFDTPESVNTELDWISADQMCALDYDLGRLVWGRINERGTWFAGTVSTESEVPPELVAEVMEARRDVSAKVPVVLVHFFDSPTNLYGWIPRSAETLQPFRCLVPKLIREFMGRLPRNPKVDHWIQCTRRALLFESLCVPSAAESPRWICVAGCGLANLPGRTSCILCRLPRSMAAPLTVDLPKCVVLGSKMLENTCVRWRGLDVTFSGADLPVGSVSVMYRNVTLIVFALASPVPFVAFYTRDLSIKPRVVSAWTLLVLPSNDPKEGALSLWGMVFQVTRKGRKALVVVVKQAVLVASLYSNG